MGRKTALVTGASSGIESAFAFRLAEKGYDLILTGRREELINKKATLIKKNWAINVDVILVEFSDDNQVESFINMISQRNINVLINNAGFGISKYYHQEHLCEWDKMVDVHIRCPIKIIYNVLPQMIKNNKGIIINVSSISSFLPIPRNSIYSGTKSFLKVFSETLNLEVRDCGVKVQALCPGFTKSDFHQKMGKNETKQRGMCWMSADDVVKNSLNCIDKDRVVCIPGFWNKAMVSLYNLLPTFFYNKMAKFFSE